MTGVLTQSFTLESLMPDLKNFTTGLHRISEHVYAYMQPDGSWGLNNMGFVVGRGRSLMIDTSTDVTRTKAAVAALAKAEPSAARIDPVLLTHWHLDHAWGACMFPEGTRIIASKKAAAFLRDNPSRKLLEHLFSLEGDAKKMLDFHVGTKFDFSDLTDVFASEEFEGHLNFDYDGQRIEVTEQKPAHTPSDSVVFMPDDGVVHMGDTIFTDRHWVLNFPGGANLIETCKFLIALDAKAYIPGHGPMLARTDLVEYLGYLEHVIGVVRDCHDKGLSLDAAFDHLLHNLGPYRDIPGPVRLYGTARMLYLEFEGKLEEQHWKRTSEAAFAEMWQLKNTLARRFPAFADVEPLPVF